MLKVIFCTDGIFPLSVGGMQRHSKLLIEALAKRNDISLVVIHPHAETLFPGFPNIKEKRINGIDVSKNYLIENYNYSKRVFEILTRYPDHIIYSQGMCVWHGIKSVSHRLIVNPHGLEPYQALSIKDKIKAIPFKLIFDYIFNNSLKVVSLGGTLTHILNNRITNKNTSIVVLPNAVNLPENNSINDPHTKLNALFLGRFASNKGIHILLKAIKELNENGYSDRINYFLGGKGPLFESYKKDYNYSNVNYLGFVDDGKLPQLFKETDVFILPTLFEGMPTVVLEAMSYGLPVIVTDVGATAELVSNENGFLIEKNNTGALKNAIVDFYNLPHAEKQRMGQVSYRKVKESFTWSKVAEEHRNLFLEIEI